MSINLTAILEVTEVVKKTSAKMFKDLKVGDRIYIKVPIKGPGRGRGTYASYVWITNLQTDEVVVKSMNELDLILDKFEFKEVTE